MPKKLNLHDISVIIIGAGSIGQRHLRNLLQLGITNITVRDIDEAKLRSLQQKYHIAITTDFSTGHYDVAVICTPSSFHVSQATQLAEKGTHLFIEKPLSSSLTGITKLEQVVLKRRLITMVGCNFRFHPGLIAVKKLIDDQQLGALYSARAEFGYYLPFWHNNGRHKQEYSANKSMGGGIILDRIHEVDYLSWLFGPLKLKSSLSLKSSDVTNDTEDLSESIFTSSVVPVISLHLDYLSQKYHCFLKIVAEKGTLLWEFPYQVKLITAESPQAIWSNDVYDINQMYLDELRYFLDCVATNSGTISDIFQAKSILSLSLKMR